MRTVVLRVAGLAVLLLLVVASVLTLQTMRRLPNALVYFVAKEGNHLRLEPVGRRIAAAGPEERAKAMVAHLAVGPSPEERARGLNSEVPSETELLDARLDDGILSVDLSADFEAGGGTTSMQGRINQLLYTLTQPREVEGVRLLIEGQDVFALGGEGILVDSPWIRERQPPSPLW